MLPPAASAAFCVPDPANEFLPLINTPPADQVVPLYSSVQVIVVDPQKINPAFCEPAPAN